MYKPKSKSKSRPRPRATITFVYYADSRYHDTDDLVKMAEEDEVSFNTDMYALLDTMFNTDISVRVEPV